MPRGRSTCCQRRVRAINRSEPAVHCLSKLLVHILPSGSKPSGPYDSPYSAYMPSFIALGNLNPSHGSKHPMSYASRSSERPQSPSSPRGVSRTIALSGGGVHIGHRAYSPFPTCPFAPLFSTLILELPTFSPPNPFILSSPLPTSPCSEHQLLSKDLYAHV